MRKGRIIFTGSLILLFLGLSFNAYACLLPVNGITATAMGNGCSTPDEQPVRQFCDAFKTLSVQSAGELHPTIDCQAFWSEDTTSVSPVVLFAFQHSRISNHPADGPPHDILLKTSVLRI